MRIGSLLLVALLAVVQSSLGSAETEPSVDSVDVSESAAVAESNDVWEAASVAAAEPSDDAAGLDSGTADETANVVAAEPGDEVAWDDFEDPEFAPGAPSSPTQSDVQPEVNVGEASPVEIEGSTLVVNGVTLGPVGVDAEGRVGRIHTVEPGDTLWDVSQAYLGTAWVWPSVWSDNREIQNPHLIEPGDRLWISSTEIRPISDQEADEYLAGAETLEEPAYEEVAAELPDDFEPDFEEAELPAADDEFAEVAAMDQFAAAEMDQLPVGMPDSDAHGNETGRVVRVSMRENMGFVSDVQLQASTSILGSPSDRQRLSMLDTVYFGLGEGEVDIGDEFTLFRNTTNVYAPGTRNLLGYHVDILGWAEVIEVADESCVAVIRVSLDGALKGDRVMPRYQTPTDIKVKYPQETIEGEVAFLPASRTLMATSDYVFVSVGATQGVEIGTDLEVYDSGRAEMDSARDQMATTPDRVIADLVVVTVQEESAVAYVAHTRRELAVGDSVRGSTRDFPGAF